MALANGPTPVRLKTQTNTNNTQMKITHLLTIAALALAFPAFAEEETPLGKEMEKASKAQKALGRASKEGKVTKDMVSKVADIKAAFEAAAKLEPAKAKDVPAAEKAKFLADYKVAMEAAIKDLDALKAAVESEKAEDVTKALDKLNAGKKEGHKAFKAD